MSFTQQAVVTRVLNRVTRAAHMLVGFGTSRGLLAARRRTTHTVPSRHS